MKKSQLQELRKVAGDLSGLYGMQDFTYNEGRAKGMRAIRMDNGLGLSATLLADRCLDIPYFSYKGINLGLVMKPGLSEPRFFNEDGARGFLKQFNGGLLTTCGLRNAGAACEINGVKNGVHGTVHNIPATNVNKEEIVENDEIFLQVSGEMREACVFAENIVLLRKIKLETERNILHIYDTVENRSFTPLPLVNLYHINFGYPFANDGTRLYFSTPDVVPNNDIAADGLDQYDILEKAKVGCAEQCYTHTGGNGAQFGLVHNQQLGLAVVVHYDIDDMPYFNEWKCMAAGDYALGMEPTATGVSGTRYMMEHNRLKYLGSGGTQDYHIRVEVLDNIDAINAYISRCKEYRKST